MLPLPLVLGAGALAVWAVLSRRSHDDTPSAQALSKTTAGGLQQLSESSVKYVLAKLARRSVIPVSDGYATVQGFVEGQTPAIAWALSANLTQTVLVPLYMASPTSEKQEFIRAVNPGSEGQFAAVGGMYAVLAFPRELAGLVDSSAQLPTTTAPIPPPAATQPASPLPGTAPQPPAPVPVPPVPPPPAPNPNAGDVEDLPGSPVDLKGQVKAILASLAIDPAQVERTADDFAATSQWAKVARRLYDHAAKLRALRAATPSAPSPAPAPAPSPVPSAPTMPAPTPSVPAASRTYVLRSGDTPSGIALRFSGSAARWRELLTVNANMREANGSLAPFMIGQTVRLPSSWTSGSTSTSASAPVVDKYTGTSASYQTAAYSPPGRVVILKAGDTPSGLALRYSGSAGKWRELLTSNPSMREAGGSLSPFRVGQTVVLPASWTLGTAGTGTGIVAGEDASDWADEVEAEVEARYDSRTGSKFPSELE